MSSASIRIGTKAYVCARYFLRPRKCFKYIDQCGEDVTDTSMRSWHYIRTVCC